MKIVLLGYMASGKSTIGGVLSDELFYPFIDLDNYIENKEKKSIGNIFKDKGEIYFRRIEHKYLKEILSSQENFILSLGGGTPCYADNISLIKNSGATSFYLQATIKTLSDRLIKEKSNRPLMASLENEKIPEFIAKHLFERRVFYEEASSIVKIDGKSTAEIVEELRVLLH
jgi:shikimate kinase